MRKTGTSELTPTLVPVPFLVISHNSSPINVFCLQLKKVLSALNDTLVKKSPTNSFSLGTRL